MLNSNQKHYPENNFWFGFLMGGTLAAGGLFLFGTKKGRRLLKKILESVEELEESLPEIINEVEEKIEENKEKIENKIADVLPRQNVDSVLQKIKSAF
jgi:gas vesicle protein